VLIEAEALDAGQVVAPIGSAVLAAVAGAAGRPLWLVAGRGRRLPSALLAAMVARLDVTDPHGDRFGADVETVPTTSVTHVTGPDGRLPMSPSATAPECEMAPELLRSSAM
jgi:hypothetical protein